jgi:hypothetical protein
VGLAGKHVIFVAIGGQGLIGLSRVILMKHPIQSRVSVRHTRPQSLDPATGEGLPKAPSEDTSQDSFGNNSNWSIVHSITVLASFTDFCT